LRKEDLLFSLLGYYITTDRITTICKFGAAEVKSIAVNEAF